MSTIFLLNVSPLKFFATPVKNNNSKHFFNKLLSIFFSGDGECTFGGM